MTPDDTASFAFARYPGVVRSGRRGEAMRSEPCSSSAGSAFDGSASERIVPSRCGPLVGLRGLSALRMGHLLVLVRRRAHTRDQLARSDPALRGGPRPPRAVRESRTRLARHGGDSDRAICGSDWRGQLLRVRLRRDLDSSRHLPVAIARCHGATRSRVGLTRPVESFACRSFRDGLDSRYELHALAGFLAHEPKSVQGAQPSNVPQIAAGDLDVFRHVHVEHRMYVRPDQPEGVGFAAARTQHHHCVSARSKSARADFDRGCVVQRFDAVRHRGTAACPCNP